MNTATPTFVVVVGHDFSEASGFAFDQAARVARRVPGSDIHVVHVAEDGASEERTQELARELRSYLEAKVKVLRGLERQAVAVHVRCGRPARELAQMATDVGADLLVVGSRRARHLKDLVQGSVSERLLTVAPCPVFVAGPIPLVHDASREPAIEPPCLDCARERRLSAGRRWWCARHAQHHAQAHSFSFRRELPLATHDSSVLPTGVDAP